MSLLLTLINGLTTLISIMKYRLSNFFEQFLYKKIGDSIHVEGVTFARRVCCTLFGQISILARALSESATGHGP